MNGPDVDEDVDPGTPMADVASSDLEDLGPDDCGVPE